MNKQYFVALCLLVTVSTNSGMELSRPVIGMGMSKKFWENLFKDPWSRNIFDYGDNWTMIQGTDQETKNEVLRQLFTPKFKKLFLKPISWREHPNNNRWVESWNRALKLGANLENVEINLWDIPDPKIVQDLINYGASTDLREPETRKTLLHKAVEAFIINSELVAVLSKKIKDDVQDNKGNTPLHTVCTNTWDTKSERLKKADLLIKSPRGKSILMQNNQGVTPFELAHIAILKHQKKNHSRDKYIIYEILRNKMEARLQEESYAQEAGYEESDFQRRHNACKEKIEQLKQKKATGNNFVQSITKFLSKENTEYKKVD